MRTAGASARKGGSSEQGFILIACLLVLLIMTILGVSLFRGFGLEERISGNTREKNRARAAAESALQYAEWWLIQPSSNTNPVTCSQLLNANLNQGAVCVNSLPSTVGDVTAVPWKVDGTDIGVQYTPPGFLVSGTAGGENDYYAVPRFYIALVGQSADGQGLIYRIDAMGYGGTPDSVAVLESTYEVGSGSPPNYGGL